MIMHEIGNVRIQCKVDSYNNWMSADPLLLQGEIAVVLFFDKSEFQTMIINEKYNTEFYNIENPTSYPYALLKAGDGQTAFSDLEFLNLKPLVSKKYTYQEVGITTINNTFEISFNAKSTDVMGSYPFYILATELQDI